MGDILVWLRDEERRLRERVGAVHGESPQYHGQALANQADRFAEAASEIERLRSLLEARAPDRTRRARGR
jgi:hypothetical protein